MSINVTVSGNPISIKRGKMVTADPNYHKNEFEKRRLIRLEQVRQQSKDIAQGVRNKVSRERKKQMKQIEEEGSERLKNWQNRKLLELQNQYKDALEELGGAHKSAANLEDENDLMAQQDKQIEQRSRNRSRIAATKLQVEKNEKSLAKSIPIQRRKIAKEVENVRSAMVSNLGKKDVKSGEPSKKKKRTASADINITIPDESSDSEYSEVVDAVTPDSNPNGKVDEVTSSSCVCTESSDSPRDPLQLSDDKVNGANNKDIKSSYKQFRLNNRLPSPAENKIRDVSPPVDNRISERIKRRDLMASEREYCSVCARTNPIPAIDNSSKIRDIIDSRHKEQHIIDDEYANNINHSNTRCSCTLKRSKPCQRKTKKDFGNEFKKSDNSFCECFKTGCPCRDMHSKDTIDHNQFHPVLPDIEENSIIKTKPSQEIPVKPRIALKELVVDNKTTQSSSKVSSTTSDLNKVQYYDHPNRFSHVKSVPSGSHVEKITADSLEVIPNLVSEREWYEKMQKRDKDAEIRGQKALEKERIQRDYKELLQKLPVLQKKERICEISKDKPEYHMSEDRLKEKERQRQNQMENAYNSLFPDLKPAVVTLPKTNPPDKSPDPESVQSINVGKWDVDYNEPKMFTAEEVQEIVEAYTNQDPKQRQQKLKELLRNLKLQKEQLLAEIKLLPVNESVNKLIDDLNSFSESKKTGRKGKEKSKRKRCDCDFDSTAESTTSSINLAGDDKHKPGSGRRTGTPRKKAKKKSRKKVLILQNTSTQTTPKVEIVAPIKEEPAIEERKAICNKLHVPCDCNKENRHVPDDELCQIFIKLHDDETPEVVVKANEQEKKGVSPKRSPKEAATKSVAVGPDEKERSAPRKLSTKHLSKDVLEKAKASTARKSKDIVEELVNKVASKKERQPKSVSKDPPDWKKKSWREQLSKNSISTSSTSYWSPPDFQKSKDSQITSHLSSFYHLKGQPKQKNTLDAVSMEPNRSAQEIQADPAMLQFVKKLLSMSRGSIENLNVSSVSTVPTPSQSIVEVENNNPAAQLQNLIRFFNEKAINIAKDLSYSPDGTALHYNSSASTSSLDKQQPPECSADQSVIAISDGSRSMVPERDSSNSHQSRDSVLAQYTDITDSCSKRIETLATMIQKIRDEKMQMLQNQPGVSMDAGIAHKSPVMSEKDYSTKYLDLPTSKEGSTHSSSGSLDEEEIYRRLIEIDLGMANKLRQLSTEKEQNAEKSVGSAPPVDDELWTRLQRLKQNDATTKSKDDDTKHPTFVPFLSDIPKLPKFEAQPDSATPSSTDGNVHRRPPPSKGLTVAKKFNGNISLVPHELSTIVEADSQLSTRLGSTSPNASKTSQNLAWKDIDLIIFPQSDDANEPGHSRSPSLREQENLVVKSPTLEATKEQKPRDISTNENTDSSKAKQCNDSTCSKQSSHSKSAKLTSSSSSDDVESIEAMLKSIGMAWAIPTLHKTQKALALSSSSSSLDLSALKKGLSNESSGSDISLKEFLRKQLMNKVSSSTFKSDASPASLLGEFSDMSAINAVNSSVDKERHKTSTPITTSKSTNKSRESFRNAVFSGDSEISSVRNDSGSQSKSN